MITIDKPRIEHVAGRVILKSYIADEGENRCQDLWFSVEEKYGDYLVDEKADAFLLPMLLRAIVSGQNIHVKASLSERLFHNVNHSVLHALSYAWGKMPQSFRELRQNGNKSLKTEWGG